MFKDDYQRLAELPVEYRNSNFDKLKSLLPGKTIELNEYQIDALCNIYEYHGAFCPIGVGWGKTFITILAPYVADSKKCLLLVPSKICDQLMEIDIPQCISEFGYDPKAICLKGKGAEKRIEILENKSSGMVVMPYSLLSTADADEMLTLLEDVDLVIADECHLLKNHTSARTRRFADFLARGWPKFVPLSGTVTIKSIREYCHLVYWSLRKHNFLPQNGSTLNELDDLLRPGVEQEFPRLWSNRPPGIDHLVRWASDLGKHKGYITSAADFRKIFGERLRSSKGVTATVSASIDASIYIDTDMFSEFPQIVEDKIKVLSERWETPEGNMIVNPLEYGKYLNQLTSGFYYETFFPPETPTETILKADRHAKFNSKLRSFLNYKARVSGYDTPFLIMEGLRSRKKEVATLQDVYDSAYFDGEPPKKDRKEVWFSDYKLQQAEKWVKSLGNKQSSGGIIWYYWNITGKKLYEYLYARFGDKIIYCPADCPEMNFHYPDKILVASERSHGTGRNLQQYHQMLFAEYIGNAGKFEQSIGREHRQGQLSDCVYITVPTVCWSERQRFEKAINEAKYIQETQTGRQKLLLGDYSSVYFGRIARTFKIPS